MTTSRRSAATQAGRVVLVVHAWLALISGYLLALTAVAWRARRRGADETSTSSQAVHRFAILVPAHDEEALIGDTVRSMVEVDYPADLFTVHVVADNCHDDTANVARVAGATAHQRDEPERPGKGPALGWLLDRLRGGDERYDAYVVVDADSVIDPRFLRVMDARLAAGERVIQAHYTVRDPGRSWSVGLRFATLAARHHLRPLARSSLGLSAGLFGNGMVFKEDVLRDRGFSDHLTEDIELHMDLLLAGERVSFAADAVLAAEMPATLRASRSQQERWERGRLEMTRTYVPRLLRRPSVQRRGQRMAQLEAAADQLVPPLSMAVGATVGAGVAAHTLLRIVRTPLARLNRALSIGLVLALAAHVLASLRMVRAPRTVYRSLVYAPLMVAWKLPLLAQVALRGQSVRWTRTARNDEDPPEPQPPVSPPGQPGPLTVMVGVPVDDVTLEEAVERCSELVEIGRATGQTHQVTTVNVDFLLTAGRLPAVRKILQSSDLAIPDGMPVVWGSRLLGTRLRQRVAGADLVPALVESAARRGYRVYLFGSAPGVAEEAAELLSKQHPGAIVVGAGGPTFADVEDMDRAALDDIIAAQPDIVCVALGHPKQELWIEAYRHEIGAPVMVGVGGSLDFLVGRKRRAPAWMQRTGLEWLHRMLTEPGRLGRRYARDLLLFPPLLLTEIIRTPSRAPTACTFEGSGVVEDGGSVVVDVRPIAHFDRVTVVSLIELERGARANGGELSLVGLSHDARRTLRGLGVESCFRLPADATAAAEGDDPTPLSRQRDTRQPRRQRSPFTSARPLHAATSRLPAHILDRHSSPSGRSSDHALTN